MTKNQKMLLGIGAIAVVGYLLWKKQQTSFTGASNRFATVGSRQKNAAGSKLSGRCSNAPKHPLCTTSCVFESNSGFDTNCVCFDMNPKPTNDNPRGYPVKYPCWGIG